MGLNYLELGFKCGIEIHQQLDTLKLFCDCPSVVRDSNPDIVVNRRLRAVAGETGEIDSAAAYEKSKEKEFIYFNSPPPGLPRRGGGVLLPSPGGRD